MMKLILRISFVLSLFFFFLFSIRAADGEIILSRGMVITESVTIKKDVYHLEAYASLEKGVIVIEGNNITIDFNGAVLVGSEKSQDPDSFFGTGVIIRGGSNITLKNAIIKGFKVGLMGRGIQGLHIEHCDFSYNFRQHLHSNREREDLADWQSYHHNEKDQWLRFGAGIYLRDCDSMDIHDNRITNGQCGLMITDCDEGLIYNNNFSFNSGIGIGMYHSSRNRILYNKVDWNVRGFSFGVYYRGQDSGGILVYDQSSNNTIAFNSVTHSGDGLFLWAGQKTLDTGAEGCNDNLIYANDFSYAPTNGIEITFSRNRVIKNILHGCWHGIWGGFSYNTIIANNDFADNLSAIAIEHGQNNIIEQNSFRKNKVGIEIWEIPNRPKEMGFMRYRDTRSANYSIRNNSFEEEKKVFNIRHTRFMVISNNRMVRSSGMKLDTTVHDLYLANNQVEAEPVIDSTYIPALETGIPGRDAMLSAGHPKGRKYIMMTPWGPYNFQYPILWWTKKDSSGRIDFDVMGPAGKWTVRKMKGVSSPSAKKGSMGESFSVIKKKGNITNIDIEMEYKGAGIEGPFGKKVAPGHPYRFHYREFAVPMEWTMKWYAFDSTSDPVHHEAGFRQLLAKTPVKTTEGNDLSSVFGRGFGKNIATREIATVSTAEIDVPANVYTIGISASEIVKVYVDDKLVIDSWDISRKEFDSDYHADARISLKGKHSIRVEQAQYGTYGMLLFEIQPANK